MISANEGGWYAGVGVNPPRTEAGLRAEQINVVAPTVDSVPPHGTSPLRGKPLRGFVQAALQPSAAFPPWAKFECAPGGGS